MEGQAILSQQLKDALNRIAASKPTRDPKSGREVLRTKIDSGACAPVIGPEIADDYPLEATEASRNGVGFVSVSGDPMPNHGQRTLVIRKQNGTPMSMRNEVCPCTGPLTSVASLIDSDNFVGFCSLGSFILNLRTNEVDWLERKDNQFELEVEIVPYQEAKKHFDKLSKDSGGLRQSQGA